MLTLTNLRVIWVSLERSSINLCEGTVVLRSLCKQGASFRYWLQHHLFHQHKENPLSECCMKLGPGDEGTTLGEASINFNNFK